MELHHKNKILDVVEKKKIIPRYLNLTLALFVGAVGYNLFLNPFKIVAGGSGGIGTILDYFYGISPSLVIFAISVLMTVLSLIFLDWDDLFSLIYITIFYPIFVSITANISNLIVLDTTDLLVISIFGGVISGVSSGVIYKSGFSTGGLNVISKVLYKYLHFSVTTSSFLINSVIVICGAFVFGVDKVLYAIIYLYISKVIADRIMIGISKEKNVYIVTEKFEKVEELIINELSHGVTILNIKGGASNEKKKMIMTAIPTSDYFKLKTELERIDNDAFMVVIDGYEVNGGQ